jgi:hypothetical protein
MSVMGGYGGYEVIFEEYCDLDRPDVIRLIEDDDEWCNFAVDYDLGTDVSKATDEELKLFHNAMIAKADEQLKWYDSEIFSDEGEYYA